jgi:hypothetical protein
LVVDTPTDDGPLGVGVQTDVSAAPFESASDELLDAEAPADVSPAAPEAPADDGLLGAELPAATTPVEPILQP